MLERRRTTKALSRCSSFPALATAACGAHAGLAPVLGEQTTPGLRLWARNFPLKSRNMNRCERDFWKENNFSLLSLFSVCVCKNNE